MPDSSRILIAARRADFAAEVIHRLERLPEVVFETSSLEEVDEARLQGVTTIIVDMCESPHVRRIAATAHAFLPVERPGLMFVLPDEGKQHLERALTLGADDFIRRGADPLELSTRATRLLQRVRVRHALAQKEEDSRVAAELTQLLASSLEFQDILFNIVQRLANTMRVERVSMVLVDDTAPEVGRVVAASDDAGVTDLAIELAKYPEIQQTLRTRQAVAIEDVGLDPLLAEVREGMPSQLNGLFLFPIVWQDSPLGVLFLRTAGCRLLTEGEMNICRMVANASAPAIRNARIMERLRHDREAAHSEAEQRTRALEAYEDLFASAPDGIAVFGRDGSMQFANPKAYDILGYGNSELHGRRLEDLLAPSATPTVRRVWRALTRERLVTDVDLTAHHKFGRELTLSASFSILDDESVLTQFRDVTTDRATASELRKTKEFLESLIDASVDAIVAADLNGIIILFNKGAERIYGYRAADVIGKRNVSCLYPKGVAQEVMRKIRCPEFGGEGRLQSMHSCAINVDGQMIPISLSAAMIYENEKPTATVGIFTDLREKILAEERLAQAQKKLEVSEKHALLAELAGTAAHELNQPLTSVMGYGELLSRKLPAGSPEHNAAQVILRETERMANLVRKIGRITKYETKSYVGDQRILDLEKSSDEDR